MSGQEACPTFWPTTRVARLCKAGLRTATRVLLLGFATMFVHSYGSWMTAYEEFGDARTSTRVDAGPRPPAGPRPNRPPGARLHQRHDACLSSHVHLAMYAYCHHHPGAIITCRGFRTASKVCRAVVPPCRRRLGFSLVSAVWVVGLQSQTLASG